MPRTCTICGHKRLADIDKALVERQPFRHIASLYDVTTGSLVRHSDDHLPAKLIRAKRTAEAVEADALLDQVGDIERLAGHADANAAEPRHRHDEALAEGNATSATGADLLGESGNPDGDVEALITHAERLIAGIKRPGGAQA